MAIDLVSKQGLAALGNGMSSVLVQILARGAVWFIFAGAMVEMLGTRGHTFPADAIALAAGAALLASTPLLHTARARAEFAPVRFRKLFLAGATSAVAMAVLPAWGGFAILAEGHLGGLAWLALAVSLLGSAIGVVRMRAAGVLLGLLTTIALLAVAAVMPSWRNLLLVLAVPGALLALPVALARLGLAREDRAAAAGVRIGDVASPGERIAVAPAAALDGEVDGAEPSLETATSRRVGC